MNETQQLTSQPDETKVGRVDTDHVDPGPAQYVTIALILGAITAVEVALSYQDVLSRAVFYSLLIVLSMVKFAIVVAYFMHLKFDSRVFTMFFAGGLVMTVLAFCAVLAMFRAF